MNTFGNRLKQLRNEKELTGDEFGKLFNVTKSAISNWETRGRFPDEDMLKRLSNYFGVTLDYLLGESDDRLIENEVKSFTVKLVQELLNDKIITDPNSIPPEIVDMIVAALKHDIKNSTK